MKCQFGELNVRTTMDGQERQLLLNSQVQGSAFLNPPSTYVDASVKPGPGPISGCVYALGWLIAGYRHPNASIVMVGLGAGTGAIQLLAACPDVDLTVVEICPEVVALARQNFPLLEYYENQGRLQIVRADAAEFFTNDQHWVVGLADAYTGKSNDIEATYLRLMHERCARLYLNIIDHREGPTMMAVEDWLASENTPVTEIYKADNILRGVPRHDSPGNWIVTNDQSSSDELQNVRPFETAPDSPGRTFVHANWAYLLDTADWATVVK